jgi:hypothetical protein
MKLKIQNSKLIISLALLSNIWTVSAQAQSITNSLLPGQTFFQTAEQYLTSANTNYTWTNVTCEASVGADYMSSVQWANDLNLQYDLSGSGTGVPPVIRPLSLDGDMRNAGIAGTVESLEGGIHYSFVQYYSVKLQGGAHIGYDFFRNSVVIEPDLGINSRLTENTFAGLRLSLPVWLHGKPLNNIPDIRFQTGFTF